MVGNRNARLFDFGLNLPDAAFTLNSKYFKNGELASGLRGKIETEMN